MAIREATKYQFADMLKELLKTREFQKIRVIELCKCCGAERQTFYYHFKDKYDLVAWIYLKDLEASIQEADGFLCETQFARLLHHLDKDRTFYKKVFSEQSQNTLSQYVYQYNVKKAEEMLKKILGEQILDEKCGF